MTYGRWGIPPLYSTCTHAATSSHTWKRHIMIYVSGSFQVDKSHFDAVAGLIQGSFHCCPTLLFCLCIDVTVSQSGCAATSSVEHLHDGVTSVLWNGYAAAQPLCTCQVYYPPHNKKKAAQIYVGGRSSSLTAMLVEVVCSPFWGVYIMEGENGERILIRHDCQVFWCSQLMLKSFDLTRFLALAVSFWGSLSFSTKPPFLCSIFLTMPSQLWKICKASLTEEFSTCWSRYFKTSS